MSELKRRSTARLVTGALVLVLLALIFGFSAVQGEDSASLSRSIAEWLAPRLYPNFAGRSTNWRRGALDMLHHLIRKAAHFSEFALLALCLHQFLRTFPLTCPGLLAVLASFITACGDEWHQTMVAGRAGLFSDVLIDTSGALVGVLFSVLLSAAIARFVFHRRRGVA